MPTAAVAKLEKQGSLDANDPLRQAIVMVDHKIRNLEKRKVSLGVNIIKCVCFRKPTSPLRHVAMCLLWLFFTLSNFTP